MYSNRFIQVICVFILVVTMGCGILGDKKKKSSIAEFGASSSCLNDFTDKINRYLKGTLSEQELNLIMDCTIDAHKDFKRFIRGNAKEGSYYPEDVHAFVTKALMTDRDLDINLIKATFELKASLFGGSEQEFSRNNIDQLIQFVEILKKETLTLLPYLHTLNLQKDSRSARAFSVQLSESLTRFIDQLDLNGTTYYSKEKLVSFMNSLAKEFDFQIPEHLVNQLIYGKTALVGGKNSGVEPMLWRPFLKSAALMVAPAAAYMVVDTSTLKESEKNELIYDLFLDAKKGIEYALSVNHQKLSLDSLKDFISISPESWTLGDQKLFFEAIDKAFIKLLSSPIVGGKIYFDQSVLDLITDRFERFVKGQSAIDEVFEDNSFNQNNVNTQSLIFAFEQYKKTISDPVKKSEIDRIIKLMMLHPSFYAYGQEKMLLDFNNPQSIKNIRLFHWANLLSEHVMKAYSEVPGKASIEVLTEIYKDYEEYAFSQKWVDASVPGWPERRFREADLFTFVSNGDDYIDIEEATELFGVAFSVGKIVDQVRADIEPICKTAEIDPLDWNWMDPKCFREEYFSRASGYWNNAPNLIDNYNNLSDTEVISFHEAVEVGARRFGYSDVHSVGSYDTVSFVGLYHYLDMMMLRFDTNLDTVLDTNEVQNAFPTFQLLLAKIAEMDPVEDEKNLRGLLGWIIKYGEPPKLDGIWDKLKFAKWANFPSTWEIRADRKDLYKIIRMFAVEEPK